MISNRGLILEYNARKKEYVLTPGKLMASFDPDQGTGLGEMVYDHIADDVTKSTIRGWQTLAIDKNRVRCIVVDVEYGPPRREVFILDF